MRANPRGHATIPPSRGLARRAPLAENAAMSREQHTWGRESRRDGSSEWPSTGFSTLSGELRERELARPRRRRKRAGWVALALPFLVTLAISGVGVVTLARHLQP